jgi:hypothetical protein
VLVTVTTATTSCMQALALRMGNSASADAE